MIAKFRYLPVLVLCAGVVAAAGWRAPRAVRPPTLRRTAASAGAAEAWGRFGGAGGNHRKHATGGGAVGPIQDKPAPVSGIEGTIEQISTSNSDGYALTTTGTVYAWGAGKEGELGNGTTPTLSDNAVEVQFPAGVRIASLPDPMPFDGGMAIDTTGHVWGWGNDTNQEFCLPHSGLLDTPTELSLSDVTLAVGAGRHAVYDAGGQVVSCGLGQYGELGGGANGPQQSATPVPVQGLPAGKVTALTAAYANAGAVTSTGAYYDWGLNNHGQLGIGSTINSATAVKVALPAAVQSVSEGGSLAGNGQTLALLTDGQVWEWGAGLDGQLGDGSISDSLSPIRLDEPSGTSFVSVSSGGGTGYAIDAHGNVWAWGDDSNGEIGDGTVGHPVKTPVQDAVTASQVSATADNVAIVSAAAH